MRRANDCSLQSAVVLAGQERFKVECYYVILDSLVGDLNRRTNAYAEINQRFCFLNPREDIDTATAAMHTAVDFYRGHLEPDLVEEWTQWTAFLRQLPANQTASSSTIHTSVDFYQCNLKPDLIEGRIQWTAFLKELRVNQKKYCNRISLCLIDAISHEQIRGNDMQSAYPNINIAFKIYACDFANCTGERSFSHLKRIKNYLRSTMLQERLSALAILNIENELVKNIDFGQLVEAFATAKSRRRHV